MSAMQSNVSSSTKIRKSFVLEEHGGTGKTYTWDNVLKTLAHDPKKSLSFETYAKVSLFGLNSIREIKREIFQMS